MKVSGLAHNSSCSKTRLLAAELFIQVPCITMQDETVWVELADLGWNQIVGAEKQKILNAYQKKESGQKKYRTSSCGKGNTAQEILKKIAADV